VEDHPGAQPDVRAGRARPLHPAGAVPDLHGRAGLDYEDLGNIVGILAVFWGISAFAMGFLSDRVGRRKVLIPAVIVFSLMSAFSGMVGGLVACC
jgi:MFS family permease